MSMINRDGRDYEYGIRRVRKRNGASMMDRDRGGQEHGMRAMTRNGMRMVRKRNRMRAKDKDVRGRKQLVSLRGRGLFRFARLGLLCTARCVASYDTQERLAGWSTEKEESSGEPLPGRGLNTNSSSTSVLKHHELAQWFCWKRDLSDAKRWRDQHPCLCLSTRGQFCPGRSVLIGVIAGGYCLRNNEGGLYRRCRL